MGLSIVFASQKSSAPTLLGLTQDDQKTNRRGRREHRGIRGEREFLRKSCLHQTCVYTVAEFAERGSGEVFMYLTQLRTAIISILKF
jgi:hypothetical protein